MSPGLVPLPTLKTNSRKDPHNIRPRLLPRALAPALVAVFSVAVIACGDSATVESDPGVDRAFATGMVPHHEAAVEMAKMAKSRAEHKEISQLADDIIRAQNAEIKTLRTLDKKLAADGVEVADVGMTDEMMGMDGDMSMLDSAEDFDREFIDMMVAHHQGAIHMARIELERGTDPALKKLAQDVVDAQSREIEQMNEWRTEWYGRPSPAGGVPAENESGDPHAGH